MSGARLPVVALFCVALPFPGACGLSSDDGDRSPTDPVGATATDRGAFVRTLDFSPFEAVIGALTPARQAELDALTRDNDLAGLRAALAADELTSRELVLFYIARIRRHDGALASVIELNPDALLEADRLDALHAAGRNEGRLHGLPLLFKDNIATGDRLHNTAGAAVLADHVPSRGAFVSDRLREAGALVLGKTNLSEWAYFMSSDAPSGYSALGGQVTHPFRSGLAVLGSSTGSAVASAARFAAATLGTETTGSIIAPAAANGVAGMRPTPGLVSADLIVPISSPLDTAGPIARHVTDLAALLTVMSARDDTDANVALAGHLHGTDFTLGLEGTTLNGLAIGVPSITLPGEDDPARAVLERVVESLTRAGATVQPVALSIERMKIVADGQPDLLAGSFAGDLAGYLDAAGAPVASLAEVIAFNEIDPDTLAPFGQDLLIRSRDNALEAGARDVLAARLRGAALAAIASATLAGGQPVDALLSLDNTFSLIYAVAGVPAVTVPAGLDATGQPHGATFVGLVPGSDATTLGIARAFERAAPLREEPVSR